MASSADHVKFQILVVWRWPKSDLYVGIEQDSIRDVLKRLQNEGVKIQV